MNITYLRRTNLFLNAALIIVVAVIGVTMAKRYLTRKSVEAVVAPVEHAEIGAGQALTLKDVNWEKNGKTVVLLLQRSAAIVWKAVLSISV